MSLTIKIPDRQLFDEENSKLIFVKGKELKLEHSLVSLAKWERIWNVPFLSQKELSDEQLYSYIKCMTITQNVDDEIYQYLTEENFLEIKKYIEAPMTAATFHEFYKKKPKRNEVTTAETIYYSMIELNIPKEYEKWHLNSLLTLIRFINVKHEEADPKRKKVPKKDVLARYSEIDKANKARMQKKE